MKKWRHETRGEVKRTPKEKLYQIGVQGHHDKDIKTFAAPFNVVFQGAAVHAPVKASLGYWADSHHFFYPLPPSHTPPPHPPPSRTSKSQWKRVIISESCEAIISRSMDFQLLVFFLYFFKYIFKLPFSFSFLFQVRCISLRESLKGYIKGRESKIGCIILRKNLKGFFFF